MDHTVGAKNLQPSWQGLGGDGTTPSFMGARTRSRGHAGAETRPQMTEAEVEQRLRRDERRKGAQAKGKNDHRLDLGPQEQSIYSQQAPPPRVLEALTL